MCVFADAQRPSRHFAEAGRVDATRLRDSGAGQLGLAADRERDRVFVGYRGEVLDQRALLLGRGIAPFETRFLRRPAKVGCGLAVEMNEGDHDLVHRAGERARERGESVAVLGCRCQRGDHDGVVTPHGGTGSERPRKPAKRAHGRGGIDGRALERARVSGDRHLDDERVAARRDLREGGGEGAQVPGPEDEPVDGVRPQRDGERRAAVWIDDVAEPGVEAIHEPRPVEGRDVRLVARGYDQPIDQLTRPVANGHRRRFGYRPARGAACNLLAPVAPRAIRSYITPREAPIRL